MDELFQGLPFQRMEDNLFKNEQMPIPIQQPTEEMIIEQHKREKEYTINPADLFKKGYFDFIYNSPVEWLFQLMIGRNYKKMNTAGIYVGETRSGKTYSALKVCENYSKLMNMEFDVEKQLFFDVKPFMQWQQTARNSICILDEWSISMNNQTWWQVQQRLFGRILTTESFKLNCYLLTLPVLSHLNPRCQDLSHLLHRMRQNYRMRCYRILISPFNQKRMFYGFEQLTMKPPSKKTIEKYEKMKRDWNQDKLDTDLEMLNTIEDDEFYLTKFKYTDYIKAFQNNALSEAELILKLKKMNYGESDIRMMINTIVNSRMKKNKDMTRQEA